MTVPHRLTMALGLAVGTLPLVGCASSGGGTNGASSCAEVISYQGQRYAVLGQLTKGVVSSRAGLGAWVYCDDNSGNGDPLDPDTTGPANVPVLAVQGVSPGLVVAVVDPTGRTELFVSWRHRDSTCASELLRRYSNIRTMDADPRPPAAPSTSIC